jgi:ribosomal protein S18 acetylase RimI-like enzyme
MEYRRYKPEDFADLYAIEEVCFQPPFRFKRRYMQRLVDAANSATWIAEADGAMTGFAIVEWTQGIRGVSAYIETIEILPDHRRRGVGNELMRLVESSAREAKALVMWLHVDAKNEGAKRMYESQGYEFYGKEDDFYAPGQGALIYKKSLAVNTEV